jgi:plastocyanin
MGDFSYAPSTLTVQVGEKVTFVNRGKIDHTVADTDAGGEIRSTLIKPRPIAPAGEQTVVFGTPGTVDYICTYHPTLMGGRIIVRE